MRQVMRDGKNTLALVDGHANGWRNERMCIMGELAAFPKYFVTTIAHLSDNMPYPALAATQ